MKKHSLDLYIEEDLSLFEHLMLGLNQNAIPQETKNAFSLMLIVISQAYM